MATNLRARSTTISGLCAFNAAACTSSPPTPSAADPAAIKSAAVSRLTPPVGTSGTCGSGPRRALMYFAPPTLAHGNTFTNAAPAFHAVITSVGVNAPAKTGLPAARQHSTIPRSNPGLTRNSAPASMHRRAVSASSTVPAPTKTWEPADLTTSRISSIAPGTVIVISATGMPPSEMASTASFPSAREDARTTGTIPISTIRLQTCSLFMSPSTSACDARANTFHQIRHFLQRNHRRVAGRGHGQRAMRSAAFHGPLRTLLRQEAINQARGKRVTTTDAVEDLEVRSMCGLIELAIGIADRSPVVQRRSAGLTQGCRDHGEGVVLHYALDHLLETIYVDGRDVFIDPRHFVAQCCGEVLLVTDHHVDVRSQRAVHFLRLLFAADRLPQRLAVVQVVADDNAVLTCCLHGFQCDFRRALRKRAEDPTGVQPSRSALAEDRLPVDVAGLKL